MLLEPELPHRDAATRTGKLPAPKRLAQWAAGVPSGGEGIAQLRNQLARLNRLVVAPPERQQLLDALSGAIAERLAQGQTAVRGQRLPLPERSRRTFALSQALREERALGHLIVAVDTRSGDGDRQRLGEALGRALIDYGYILLRAAQVYTPVSRRFWHNLHASYGLAESSGVSDATVDNLTVAQHYKRSLLFAVGHAYGLQRADAEHAYALLARWAARARLTRVVANTERHLFRVDLSQPRAPAPHDDAAADLQPEQRVLAVDVVVASADRLSRLRGPAGDRGSLSPSGLAHLLTNWRRDHSRTNGREQRDEAVDAEIGLLRIHERLQQDIASGHPDAPPQPPSAVALTGKSDEFCDPYAGFVSHPGRTGTARREDVWTRAIERKDVQYFRERSRLTDSGWAAPVNNPQRAWQLADSSPNGLRLRWVGEGDSNATVGEVVGIHYAGRPHPHWALGVVRWLRFTEEDRFNIGVHILARDVQPARVRRPVSGGTPPPHEPALLLGTDIVLPAFLFQAGATLEMEYFDQIMRIELGDVLEQTGSFALYEITVLPPARENEIPEWTLL